MSLSFQNAVRRVVPRWNNLNAALFSGELDPSDLVATPKKATSDFVLLKEAQWAQDGGLFFALDLINSASVLGGGGEQTRKAAEYVLSSRESTSAAKKIAARLLGVEYGTGHVLPIMDRRGLIKENKIRRLAEPRNAFVWIELARLYVLNGMVEQALKPVEIALALAPSNRFVVRCAARYFLHANKASRALDLVRRTPATLTDPWLIAAEIAISSVQEKKPKFAAQAKSFIENKAVNPFHTSEAASALASLEMWSGNDKRARKIFLESLASPTENSLAQAIWASTEVDLSAFQLSSIQLDNAFEAGALEAKNKGDWQLAVKNCAIWAENEAYSSRPYGMASAIYSSLLGEPKKAEELIRFGLLTNPGHPGLLNNIAFAMAEQGNAKGAQVELSKVDLNLANDQAKACLVATSGLVEYRLGNAALGREMYEKTILFSSKMSWFELKATAQMYLAREEARLGNEGYTEIFEKGYAFLKVSDDVFLVALAAKIKKDIEEFGARNLMTRGRQADGRSRKADGVRRQARFDPGR